METICAGVNELRSSQWLWRLALGLQSKANVANMLLKPPDTRIWLPLPLRVDLTIMNSRMIGHWIQRVGQKWERITKLRTDIVLSVPLVGAWRCILSNEEHLGIGRTLCTGPQNRKPTRRRCLKNTDAEASRRIIFWDKGFTEPHFSTASQVASVNERWLRTIVHYMAHAVHDSCQSSASLTRVKSELEAISTNLWSHGGFSERWICLWVPCRLRDLTAGCCVQRRTLSFLSAAYKLRPDTIDLWWAWQLEPSDKVRSVVTNPNLRLRRNKRNLKTRAGIAGRVYFSRVLYNLVWESQSERRRHVPWRISSSQARQTGCICSKPILWLPAWGNATITDSIRFTPSWARAWINISTVINANAVVPRNISTLKFLETKSNVTEFWTKDVERIDSCRTQ